jgi:hypothetical protein
MTFLFPQPLRIPSSPVEEIVQQARERAETLLHYSSAARALSESAFFDFLDEVLQANDDCPSLAEALDEVAVEYRWVCQSVHTRLYGFF